MTDDLLYQRRRYLFLGHHGNAGIYFDRPKQGEYSVYIDNYKDRTEGDVTTDLIVSVEGQELMRKSVSMGGSSPTWKFNIEAAPCLREGIEYYVGSIIEPSDGDRLNG
jgi:hypothetical protein